MASSSDEGARWLLKALHPAEPSVSNVRIPDGTAMDTVAVETCLTYSLAPVSATPWGADMTLLPHPTCMMEILPNGGAIASPALTIRNTLFKAATADDDILNLVNMAEEWRMTAMSVTIHLDANATKDSGTVVAAQIPVKPNLFIPYGAVALSNTVYSGVPAIFFDANDQPSYGTLMQMPRAYQSNLRTGLYMPLRLTNTSQHWRSRREICKLLNPSMIVGEDTFGSNHQPYVTSTATTPAYPNWDLSPAKRDATGQSFLVGGAMSPFLGDSFGRICITNVDPSSAVVIKIKLGLELKVQPYSTQAVHLEKAPSMDAMAIASYFAVTRQLPDAYPADYNDGGKILNMIGRALRGVAPLLNGIPGIGPMLSAVATPAAALAEYGSVAMANRRKKGNGKKLPPALPPRPQRKKLPPGTVLVDPSTGTNVATQRPAVRRVRVVKL